MHELSIDLVEEFLGHTHVQLPCPELGLLSKVSPGSSLPSTAGGSLSTFSLALEIIGLFTFLNFLLLAMMDLNNLDLVKIYWAPARSFSIHLIIMKPQQLYQGDVVRIS